jgi:hypothetical protein
MIWHYFVLGAVALGWFVGLEFESCLEAVALEAQSGPKKYIPFYSD